jgi:hypothetical protein
MTDVIEALRDYLLTKTDLTTLLAPYLTSYALFGGMDTPGPGYTPAQGGAICFTVRGGQPDYSDALLKPSIQMKCYGSSPQVANRVYRALYGVLHNARGGSLVRWAQCDVLGQSLTEPSTGWPFTLSFFTVWIGQP